MIIKLKGFVRAVPRVGGAQISYNALRLKYTQKSRTKMKIFINVPPAKGPWTTALDTPPPLDGSGLGLLLITIVVYCNRCFTYLYIVKYSICTETIDELQERFG